jgi:hypothetical protein
MSMSRHYRQKHPPRPDFKQYNTVIKPSMNIILNIQVILQRLSTKATFPSSRTSFTTGVPEIQEDNCLILVIAFKFIDPNLLSPTLQWITTNILCQGYWETI